MNELIQSVERRQLRKNPEFREGDRVRVHFQVIEGNRKRTQVFEGIVLKLQGAGARRTFTVRKLSFGVGVERTFPLHSPKIERIEIAARGEVRRAKLYYLRGKIGKRARVRERRDLTPEEIEAMGAVADDESAEAIQNDEPTSENPAAEDTAPPEDAADEQADNDSGDTEAQADGASDASSEPEAKADPEADNAEGAAAEESGDEPAEGSKGDG